MTKIKDKHINDYFDILKTMPSKVYKDYEEFSNDSSDVLLSAKFNVNPSIRKTIEDALSEKDENALPQKDGLGKLLPDPDLRDYENIPLKNNINEYFEKEVKPFVPDAWINESTMDKVGYEIPFSRHFYTYKPLRSPDEIDFEIRKIQTDIAEGLKEVND